MAPKQQADDKGTPPPDDKGDADKGTSNDEVTIDPEALAAAVAKVLPDVLKTAGLDKGDADDKGDKGTPPPDDKPVPLRQQEARMEDVVRAELGKITKEKDLEERVNAIDERTKERPPGKVRLLTRVMFGNPDQ